MKIQALNLYEYKIRLKKPLLLKGGYITHRQGLVLKITTESGQSIATDIAPLPYFHRETTHEIIAAFNSVKQKLTGSFWSLQLLLNADNILLNENLCSKYPSLNFAIEMAILSLLMPKLQIFQDIPINAFCAGTDEEILQKIPSLKSFQSIKIKRGSRTPEELSQLTEKIIALMTPHQKLRIDFNRSYTLEELKTFCTSFPIDYCDYLEEPLQNPLELLAFSNDFHHPLAYDESLLDTSLEFLLTVPTKKAFVIKPTLLGSLQKVNKLYSKAQLHNLQFILTSAFESGLGHLMVAHLAHYFALEDPIGLDTYHYLENDILSKPLAFSKNILSIHEQHLLNPYIHWQNLNTCV